MAAHFFSTVGPGHLAAADFLQSRKVFDQACPHDHLRCTFDLLLIPFVHDFSWHLVEEFSRMGVFDVPYLYRFVGQGLKIDYEHCKGSSLQTFITDITLDQMELLECLFPSETVGGSQRGIQYTEVRAKHMFHCTEL